MKRHWFCGMLLLSILVATVLTAAEPGDSAARRKQADAAMKAGNFKDAYQGFRKLVLDRQDDPRLVGADLTRAVDCLGKLNREEDLDALLEDAVKLHADGWRLLQSAAEGYAQATHCGHLVAGKFCRHSDRNGRYVHCDDRDRVRALQLMLRALPLALKDENHADASEYLLTFAKVLLGDRYNAEPWRLQYLAEPWRLQYLSDLSVLPDYSEQYPDHHRGAPVDPDGQPIFYPCPKTFELANSDGQRWRWCLQKAAELDPKQTNRARLVLANFLQSQFGLEKLTEYKWRTSRMAADDANQEERRIGMLRALGEDETIAQLATGVKRIKLPAEFNFIRLYRQIADSEAQSRDRWSRPADAQRPNDGSGQYAVEALEQLARVFENRAQYPKAADCWRRLLRDFPDEPQKGRQQWQQRLDQIVGNWGRFAPGRTQPAGRPATVEYRFRNGRQVQFTAHEIEIEKLLDDVKAFLKSYRSTSLWQNADVSNIGRRLVDDDKKKYVGRPVAQWRLPLEPREGHCDRLATVTMPFHQPGGYLVEANMDGGNTSFIVVWVDDTVILQKPVLGRTYYFVADAVTGEPIPKANVEFFGRKAVERPPQKDGDGDEFNIVTRQFAELTDAGGQVMCDASQQPKDMQWLVTARTSKGRFAYLGFRDVWYPKDYEAPYHATKAYAITDRPVYMPKQRVHYKFWVRRAQYDMADDSDFANRTFRVDVRSPKDDKVLSVVKKADAYGGIEGEYSIPAEATLGIYSLTLAEPKAPEDETLGSGRFRVEEYKKPEFEVTVEAPAEPVILGEKVTATIKARYYFGSPVTNARVKYEINRAGRDHQWYPAMPWDWLYGPGYWWFAYDCSWYPGWSQWGCAEPLPYWLRNRDYYYWGSRELVADQEAAIGPDGALKVEIDTAAVKAAHPNQDHSYTITAEVIDQSRRAFVGSGTVLVARKPFSVYAWVDHGYYNAGDTIHAHFAARTLDGKPVHGKGQLRLLRIGYENGQPVQTPVQGWPLDTNAQGMADRQFDVSQPGQYRLSYLLSPLPPEDGKGEGSTSSPLAKDDGKRTIEGGYLFTVTGKGFDGAQLRFNHLELIPDKAQYAPGDTVKLQINTDRVGSTVLLFCRPVDGVYLPPKVIRLRGKSTIEEIGVAKTDMPNFFVEAVTIADGRTHTALREIIVPPEKRVLNVEIRPSKEAYSPGEKAKVKIKLTDLRGTPFVGSTVVAIYDKSVEYISGGSNVPDIKESFWKWRREHRSESEASIRRWFTDLVRPDSIEMNNLGLTGGTVGEKYEWSDLEHIRIPEGEGSQDFDWGDGMVRGLGHGPAHGGKGRAIPIVVRKKFADTALWVGALATDQDGTAEVSLDMPENLTTWRIKVWAMGHGTQVGEGFCDVVTRKDLLVRLEAPRFFVETDQVVLSTIVHNYLKTKKRVTLQLELDGEHLGVPDWTMLADSRGHKSERFMYHDGHGPRGCTTTVEVEPNSEARVDWTGLHGLASWDINVLRAGDTTVRVKAITDEQSDAMEQKFPCYLHGMPKTDSYSGSLRPNQQSGQFTVTAPEARDPQKSRLEVRWSPTLAGAMVDALPYLIDYPYGCTEQTLNRFLPAAVTQKILLDMKLDLKEIQTKRTNLNAQEIGDDAQRAKQWKHDVGRIGNPPHDGNPVFDQDELRKIVKQNVQRLTEMQLSDGGWGWFSGRGEHSDAHTTALVVRGLQIARQNDVALVPGMLDRGIDWLKHHQAQQVQLIKNAAIKDKQDVGQVANLPYKEYADNLDAFVYMVLSDAGVKYADMLAFLYRDRTHLAVYGMAMYGLALEKQGEKEKLSMILRNIGQYVEQDDENQTAWLRLPDGDWWYWYGSQYEAHAYYLKLLSRTDPRGELAPRLVKYLLNNRKHATYWNSTRDTALCVEAMADFIRRSGEDRPNMTVEVHYDGKLQKAVEITPQNLFQFDSKLVLEGGAISAGRHTVELKKKGAGPLYYNAYMTNFTLEDFIKHSGLEIKVNRKYYKLIKADKSIKAAGSRGQPVDQKVENFERQELPRGLSPVSSDEKGTVPFELKSGDLVEIELEIDSKNDYEYLVFEDMKPSGFEPVDLRSGYTGNDLGAYVEFRDNRVVFFARTLARGKHSVSYRMRAETPGHFSALPTRAWAMYAPELKANSDELKLRVEDPPPNGQR